MAPQEYNPSLEQSSNTTAIPSLQKIESTETLNNEPQVTTSIPIGSDLGWKKDASILGIIFLCSTISIGFILHHFLISKLTNEEWQQLRFPMSIQAAQELEHMLQSYMTHYYMECLFVHMCCYLYLQTFAIPGTVFFNLLGGALFGVTLGFPLCLFYNTLGSVFMYLLSHFFGKRVIYHTAPNKLRTLRELIDNHRSELALYMVFMRVFPFSPNWFINMASPHVGVPLLQFILGPLFGLIPYNFLSCKAGLVLHDLQSKHDIIDTTTTIQLIVIALIGGVVLPQLKKRFSRQEINKKQA